MTGVKQKPIARSYTLTNQVYKRLKEQIINREIDAGTRLIVGRVAEQLGTSLTPVRETLRLLEKDGLVVTTPHKGAVVTTPSRKQFEDIFAVRAVIEGLAIKMTCPWFTSQEIKKLEEVLERGRTSVSAGDANGWIGSDEQFHKFISEKYDNAFLHEMVTRILDHIRIFRKANAPIDPTGLQAAVHEHEAIISALKERDAAGAEKRMIEHIQNSFARSLQGASWSLVSAPDAHAYDTR